MIPSMDHINIMQCNFLSFFSLCSLLSRELYLSLIIGIVPLFLSFILINYLFIKKKKKIEEEFDVEEQIKVKFYAGIKHVGGDMYVSVPKGDAIILKVS
jgi:hypothetical protein